MLERLDTDQNLELPFLRNSTILYQIVQQLPCQTTLRPQNGYELEGQTWSGVSELERRVHSAIRGSKIRISQKECGDSLHVNSFALLEIAPSHNQTRSTPLLLLLLQTMSLRLHSGIDLHYPLNSDKLLLRPLPRPTLALLVGHSKPQQPVWPLLHLPLAISTVSQDLARQTLVSFRPFLPPLPPSLLKILGDKLDQKYRSTMAILEMIKRGIRNEREHQRVRRKLLSIEWEALEEQERHWAVLIEEQTQSVIRWIDLIRE